MHLNIRSIIARIYLIRAWAAHYKPDILTFSETWLHRKICDNEIIIYYTDQTGVQEEEVWLYMSLHTLYLNLPFLKHPHCFLNVSLLSMKINGNRNLIIGSIYRPPPVHSDSTKCILSIFTSFEHSGEIIILGDFNCNCLDRFSSNDRNLLKGINLIQLINKPTRIDARSIIIRLDLCYSF